MRTGAIVLCGGRSSRMGRDKASLPFGSETMLQRVVRIVSDVVDPSRIVVVAASEQQIPPLPDGVQCVEDLQPHWGPLAGLAIGLRALKPVADVAFVTSCDVPLLNPQWIQQLFGLYSASDAKPSPKVVVPRDSEFAHPLSAVYCTDLLLTIETLLASDERRPRALFGQCETLFVPTEALRISDPDLNSLMNVNSPEEYERALQKAGLID